MAIPLHIRKKIAEFDPLRDGKTITQFCKETNISRQTYHNIRKRIAQHGPSGILAESTAPKTPARKYDNEHRDLVYRTRETLKEQGRDYGPWSIYYYLVDELAITDPPQRSTIAYWLHHAGLTETNARKRPRSSYTRFARSMVNELWQIDGFTYRLFDAPHTQITIYQIIDDASRFDVGSQAFANPENGRDAREALACAMDNYGIPQEVLSDNGEAFATYHKGRLSQTEQWLASKGVWSIAGFAPSTQGKDERSHQTLTRYLDARTPTTLADVQRFLAEYRQFYNTRRRHQGLVHGKAHLTPAQAWDMFEHAPSPTQPIDPDVLWARIVEQYTQMNVAPHDPRQQKALAEVATPVKAHGTTSEPEPTDSPATDSSTIAALSSASSRPWEIPDQLWINLHGVVTVLGYRLYVGTRWKNRVIVSVVSQDKAEFYTEHDGELLFSFPLPICVGQRPAGGQINIGHVQGMWHIGVHPKLISGYRLLVRLVVRGNRHPVRCG